MLANNFYSSKPIKMKIIKIKNKQEIKKRTVRGRYHEIEDWSMDPNGYFLIKIELPHFQCSHLHLLVKFFLSFYFNYIFLGGFFVSSNKDFTTKKP